MVNEAARRRRMVRELEQRGIAHPLVLKGMGEIARARFVDEALRGKAYDDDALPIGDGQTISQPWIVARMTELLEPAGTGRVLEIGTGSGYHAAVLSRVFEQVYSVERILALSRKARARIRELGIENVHFKVFDGSYGWSEFAPYRAIVVTAAVPRIVDPLVEQLEDGGIMVMPVGPASGDTQDRQTLIRVVRQGSEIVREEHGECRFVPFVGKYGWDR